LQRTNDQNRTSRNGAGDQAPPSSEEELKELLSELRVTLPGIQIIFAFLLVVPFQNRFEQLTAFQQHVYFVAFVAAATCVILLVAPGTIHRIISRPDELELKRLLSVSTILAISGSVFLALALTCVVLLISDLLFDTLIAAACAAAAAGLTVWLWFGLPLLRYGHK